jgi:hypothetical protein
VPGSQGVETFELLLPPNSDLDDISTYAGRLDQGSELAGWERNPTLSQGDDVIVTVRRARHSANGGTGGERCDYSIYGMVRASTN